MAVAGAVAVGAPFVVAGTANAASDVDWDKLAQCESGGKWGTNTGNGFGGGLQFTPSTWRANGGKGSAQNASRAEQIAVAERVLASQGPGAWPTCSKKTGLSKSKAQPGKKAAAPAKPAPAKPAPAKPAPAKPAPAAAPVAPIVKNGADYTVAAGDSLSKIATARNVPGGWKAIFDRNADVLSNPHALRPGQQLDLV